MEKEAPIQHLKKNYDILYGEELSKIFKNASIGVGGILISYAISYLASVIATRVVGARYYGVYYLADTVFIICGFLVSLGLFRGVLRYVSLYSGQGDKSRIKGTILLGVRLTLISSVLATIAILGFSRLISEGIFHKTDLTIALRILIISLPFSALTSIFLSALQGLRLIKYHVLVNNIIRPSSRLIILVILFMVGTRFLGLLWAMVLTGIIGFLCSFYFLKRNCASLRREVVAVYERTDIMSFSMPLFFERFLNYLITSSPVLIIGYFMASADVGIYGIGVKLGQLVILSLTSFNMIFAPTISLLYGRGEKTALESLFKTVTKWTFTIGFAVFLILILFGRPILSIFGKNFVFGINALYLIALGQLFEVSVGSSEYILMMTGRPKMNLMNSSILFVLTIILCYVFIKGYGIAGAALATAISLVVVNILRLIEVYHFERIHPYKPAFFKPIVSGLLSAIVIYTLGLLVPYRDNISVSILFGVIFVLLFIAFLRILRLESEDRYILGLVRRKLISLGA